MRGREQGLSSPRVVPQSREKQEFTLKTSNWLVAVWSLAEGEVVESPPSADSAPLPQAEARIESATQHHEGGQSSVAVCLLHDSDHGYWTVRNEPCGMQRSPGSPRAPRSKRHHVNQRAVGAEGSDPRLTRLGRPLEYVTTTSVSTPTEPWEVGYSMSVGSCSSRLEESGSSPPRVIHRGSGGAAGPHGCVS